ncbi:MAG: FIST N-terminal domain-containing protein [Synoicihabitans sp.]
MKTCKLRWEGGNWTGDLTTSAADAQLVFLFGAGNLLRDEAVRSALRGGVPQARIVGCSTAGEILGSTVGDGGVVALAITFGSTQVRCAKREVGAAEDSYDVGLALSQELAGEGLRHVILLSNGLKVNGTRLVAGLRQGLPDGVSATGGLAGDGSRFQDTTVVLDDDVGSAGVIAVGLYGSDLDVHWGSAGGWEAFGPRRRVTRSVNNVLYELDNRPALELYKTYLGERAEGLPATGLLFPLELLPEQEGDHSLVRTILAVDETEQSLTFAGDVPQDRYVRLMKSTIDKLIWGAETAGGMAGRPEEPPGFALLVSCVGRRLVLNQRVEEEVEAVLDELGQPEGVIGFYSYGEIGPGGVTHGCELHNQTMTLTTFTEKSHG